MECGRGGYKGGGNVDKVGGDYGKQDILGCWYGITVSTFNSMQGMCKGMTIREMGCVL